MQQPPRPTPPPESPAHRTTFETQRADLKRRLHQEASQAVAMVEQAIRALWTLDVEAAREVRRREDGVDREEVQIEQQCFHLLAIQGAYARDFRSLTFVLKVNADVERVADHAASIAKVTRQLKDKGGVPVWPQALRELGDRVPVACHALLRAMLDEDAAAAREVVAGDQRLDDLERRVFEEILELMDKEPGAAASGMLLYRVGRELERIGDLLSNIAEDIIYLATGEIVRHGIKRELRAGRQGT